MKDQLQRFLFEDFQIRGEIANADNSFRELLANHNYTEEVRNLMGELLIAATLLTAMLKFEGKITVQLQGDGPLKMAVINISQDLVLRGTANVDGETSGLSFAQLVGEGHLMISITPKNGERYQGIVALDKTSLSACIENYFTQSEQLTTRIILHANSQDNMQCAGLLLQTLPMADVEEKEHDDDFQHVCALAHTVKATELYELTHDELLFRLYHQDKVRLFDEQSIIYQCSCSKERCISSLASIQPKEILEILKEESVIEMHCEYCAKDYRFDINDLQILLTDTNEQQH